MKRIAAGALLLPMLLVALPAGPAPAGEAARPVSLRTVPLQAPGTALSKSDTVHNGRTAIAIDNGSGAVGPSKSLLFSGAKKEGSITIGGSEFKLALAGNGLAVSATGMPRVQLRSYGAGFASQMLPLAGKRRYILAFPLFYRSRKTARLYYRSGSVQQGSIDGTPVSLYDDNTDGAYTKDADTLQVGRTLVFAPISGLLATRSAVYKIGELARDGGKMSYSKHEGETGKFSAAFLDRNLVGHMVFGSSAAGLNLTVQATASGSQQLAAVPGKYELLYGLAYWPARRKAVAGVLPGGFKPVEVEKGKTAKAQLGKVRLEMSIARTGDKVDFNPRGWKLCGENGEEYVSYKILSVPAAYIIYGGRKVASAKMGGFG